jgi:hypothetical protein
MCLNLTLLAGRLGCRGDGAAAQPSLLSSQAALVGKGSLSSFDHFAKKNPKRRKSFGKSLKKSHCALAAKDNTLAGVPRGFPPRVQRFTIFVSPFSVLACAESRLPRSAYFVECDPIFGVGRARSVHKAGYGHNRDGAAA